MPWAVNVDGTSIRLEDLKLANVLAVLDGKTTPTSEVIMQLIGSPLSDFPTAIKIASECAKLAGQDDPQAWVDGYLDKSWIDFTKLFVEVEDDLPYEVRDGVPPEGDDGSTVG